MPFPKHRDSPQRNSQEANGPGSPRLSDLQGENLQINKGELGRPPSRRNPFPGEHFFMVPIALYDSGLARLMRPSQIIRYVTLLRVANYKSEVRVSVDLQSLEKLDGVSSRAARDAHIKLQEFGLIGVEKTNPFTYTLFPPSTWPDFGKVKPIFGRGRSLKIERGWVDKS